MACLHFSTVYTDICCECMHPVVDIDVYRGQQSFIVVNHRIYKNYPQYTHGIQHDLAPTTYLDVAHTIHPQDMYPNISQRFSLHISTGYISTGHVMPSTGYDIPWTTIVPAVHGIISTGLHVVHGIYPRDIVNYIPWTTYPVGSARSTDDMMFLKYISF